MKNADLYLLLLPAVVYYLVFHYIPMGGLVIAFKEYNIFKGIWESDWAGLQYFREMLQVPDFGNMIRNTLVLNLLSLLVGFPAPIVLALLLNEVTNRYFKRISQSLLYLPHFMSWVVLGGIVYNLLSPQYGFINSVLAHTGIKPIYFMIDEFWWVVVYVLSDIWHGAGWGTIIYLAALTSIDPSLYEAAVVDGAGRWKKLVYITLPSLLPTIVILLIMNVGRLVSIGFEQPFALANAAVTNVAEVISTYTYNSGIKQGNFSIATAVGFLQAIINLALISGANYTARRLRGEGLW
ncbi:MAG: binding-protein-dependent transport system inner rane component [Paenibacillaceae bacterium]|nr:binding-protein-dependent transport system inner rane component [Paenibacillaceae bacterium]